MNSSDAAPLTCQAKPAINDAYPELSERPLLPFDESPVAASIGDTSASPQRHFTNFVGTPAQIHDLPEELYSRIWDFLLEPDCEAPSFIWEVLVPSADSALRVRPAPIAGGEKQHYIDTRGRTLGRLALLNANARSYLAKRYVRLVSNDICEPQRGYWVDRENDVFALLREVPYIEGIPRRWFRPQTWEEQERLIRTAAALRHDHPHGLRLIRNVIAPVAWFADLRAESVPCSARYAAVVDSLPCLRKVFIIQGHACGFKQFPDCIHRIRLQTGPWSSIPAVNLVSSRKTAKCWPHNAIDQSNNIPISETPPTNPSLQLHQKYEHRLSSTLTEQFRVSWQRFDQRGVGKVCINGICEI
ncbi:uncharacterized protein JN550_004397 [Neoarthrinium moseri]|uniref:uncharacterized protein n=1 Tax=Neoarthrinium moseri TaxID=1658444 RepID=UPI001FDB41A8|nr:uncharacterized protein JN550_004397 [Neoarthrinium moseri]KAI1871403.1 hypothetical protein JN550_004397 [Neoarthrinium moseri]